MKTAAFIDRDGIINVDKGYVHKKEDVSFVPGIFRLCRLLQEKGFKIIVITNQSGIARGLYDVEDFNRLMEWMKVQFAEHGINIAGVYFCPHHPTEGQGEFKKDCQCRKPKPGMLLKAQQELDIDLTESVLIGDKETDIQAGLNAGIKKNFLIGNCTKDQMTDCLCFSNLEELLEYIDDVIK